MIGARDLNLITTLARELHFRRAAELLAMRQPQLSVRLAQIERSLGVTLFVRRPRVALTPAGEVIADAARRAIGDFNGAVEHARLVERGKAGSIVAAVASTVMLSDLPLSPVDGGSSSDGYESAPSSPSSPDNSPFHLDHVGGGSDEEQHFNLQAAAHAAHQHQTITFP